MSKRCLIFFAGTVAWECSQSYVPECLERQTVPRQKQYSRVPIRKVPPWPSLHLYANLVQNYSSRNLSYPADAERAFTAILSTLSGPFPGSPQAFLYGIPTLRFDFGLSWSRSRSYHAVEFVRREAFPSWSWLGWTGEVDFDEHSQLEEPRLPTVRFVTIVMWTIEDETSMETITIPNDYHHYQSMQDNAKAILPHGWSSVPQSYPRRSIHRSYPTLEFLHPLPIAISSLPQSGSQRWSQILRGTTEVGVLELDRQSRDGHEINMRTVAGAWAGILTPDLSMQEAENTDSLCDMIVISGAVIKRRQTFLPELDHREELQSLDVYKFYRVLWVHWNNGIAYRKGIGRAWKPIWDKQGFHKREIRLGGDISNRILADFVMMLYSITVVFKIPTQVFDGSGRKATLLPALGCRNTHEGIHSFYTSMH